MPAMLLLRYGAYLTVAIIDRRPGKRDAARDVLEKVTLIKDIRLSAPHRAHVEILYDLALPTLGQAITTFDQLHEAWRAALSVSELNKRFYQEIANWYFWARKQVRFPQPPTVEDDEAYTAQSVIRLVTRLIFCWFLREKGLIPDALFDEGRVKAWLNEWDEKGSSFYKAVLQNLFFATLNTEMDKRRGRGKTGEAGGRDQHYMVHNVFRYREMFKEPEAVGALFKDIPFLNGGLFECLDKAGEDGGEKNAARVDGFSERPDNPLDVPNGLFFADPHEVDLNAEYETSNRHYKVRGLIKILDGYKFTVAENTPVEEEVALDPELLGKVFENLLAAYNPETGVTARKQTGSFYTPREIVNYMVDESLVAYLGQRLAETQTSEVSTQERLRHLLAYNDEPHRFDEAEVGRLIAAIDALKVLDPACGSGAFPMGVLHKLVFMLGKLDPHNAGWKQRQLAKAEEFADATVREQAIADIEQAFARNALDYGRKLYLIENCIYGVDIQPIAVQIAKLRCFISLVVDEQADETQPNRGVRALPNLETKFVAANSLLGIERPEQLGFADPALEEKRGQLKDVRHRLFAARTPQTKERLREQDKTLRAAIATRLKESDWPSATAEQLAAWDPYDQNSAADFFDAEWMFGLRDGFDVVIGNPPYVRQEQIREFKPAFQKQYECYTGTADLYVYCYERGFTLLRASGVLTYISSNKYFRSAYGEKLRGYLGQKATIHELIDFGDAPVFTAIAYPSIITLQKTPPDGQMTRAFNWRLGPPIEEFERVFRAHSFLIAQKELTRDGWRLEMPSVLRLLEKLRKAGQPLGEYVNGRFYRGILTGLNEAFVVDRVTRDRLIKEHPSSAEVLKPFLRGRDVKRWVVEPQDLWLIFTRRGINIKKYPAIYEHVHQLVVSL
ncbi:MAG: Eco57I restriction-modification methylase domain-containing protein [Chloroflexi bacterium]|nr:Eco57I restriction-modification methylase domain-containing protein [Chloroflexota bacterium]